MIDRKEKFTPGPWRFWRHVNKNCPAASQTAVFGTSDRRLVMIAQTHTDGAAKPEQSVEELIANAHLIAAAPEMYEWQRSSLDVLQQICRSLNTTDNIRIQLEPLIYNGEKLQKKARGEE